MSLVGFFRFWIVWGVFLCFFFFFNYFFSWKVIWKPQLEGKKKYKFKKNNTGSKILNFAC